MECADYYAMPFELFDPQGELQIEAGRLPHWYQPGVTYFVTFRTKDSIPAELAERWRRQRNDWLRRHGIDPRQNGWSESLRLLLRAHQQEFHRLFSHEYENYLDRGLGACVLKEPSIAQVVAESLMHFDGERYHLGDFVVMPNHVHLIVCMIGDTCIEPQCKSWKRYTARAINLVLGQRGRFWQEESFDHLVRSPEQFEHLQRYIAENPLKAGLHEGQYLHSTHSSQHTPCADSAELDSAI